MGTPICCNAAQAARPDQRLSCTPTSVKQGGLAGRLSTATQCLGRGPPLPARQLRRLLLVPTAGCWFARQILSWFDLSTGNGAAL